MSLIGKFIKIRYFYNINGHKQDKIIIHAKIMAESDTKICVLARIIDSDFEKLQKLSYKEVHRHVVTRHWDDILDVIDDESLINWADEAKKLDNLIK